MVVFSDRVFLERLEKVEFVKEFFNRLLFTYLCNLGSRHTKIVFTTKLKSYQKGHGNNLCNAISKSLMKNFIVLA